MTFAFPVARTNYIFIDFENVHETDWARIIGKPVKVTLVLGEQHQSLPVHMVKQMLQCPGQVELIETRRTGKGAADIVLAQHIGERNKDDPHGYFHIISGDKGFDALIAHLKEHGILAARRASLSAIPVLMNTAERVEMLATFFRDHPVNRPKKRETLESQIQTVFGKTLSPEDVAATVQGLVAGKVIELSAAGEVVYRDMEAATSSGLGTTRPKSSPIVPHLTSSHRKSSPPSKPPMSTSPRSRTV